jgi:hypothetical protein
LVARSGFSLTTSIFEKMKVSAGGIAWYRNKEEYERLLTIFEDSHKLHPTYEGWLAAAEQGLKAMQHSNPALKIVKVIIDPDEFPKWCAANGHKLDAEARIAYGNLMAYRSASGLSGRN